MNISKFSVYFLFVLLLGARPNLVDTQTDLQRQKETVAKLFVYYVALQAYHDDHGRYPHVIPSRKTIVQRLSWGTLTKSLIPAAWPVGKSDRISSIESELVPFYLRKSDFTAHDAWEHPILYTASEDGAHFTVVSLGRDGEFDKTFQGYQWEWGDYDNDVIITENSFISSPEGITR